MHMCRRSCTAARNRRAAAATGTLLAACVLTACLIIPEDLSAGLDAWMRSLKIKKDVAKSI